MIDHNKPYDSMEEDSSREIQSDIRRTRTEMDRTIDKLSEKLNPRHLLDDFIEVFRGGSGATGERVGQSLKTSTRTLATAVRRHPIPALLCASGVVWYLFEHGEEEEVRRLEYHPDYTGTTGTAAVGSVAWEDDFDWEAAQEDRESWKSRVEKTISEWSRDDSTTPPHHRVRSAAASLVSLSGHRPETIRSTAPYTDDTRWHQLHAADTIASAYEDDDTLSDKAASLWQTIKSSVSDSSKTAAEKLRDASNAIAEYAHQTGRVTKSAGRGIGASLASAGSAVGSAASYAGHGIAHAASSTGSTLRSAASSTGSTLRSAAHSTGSSLSHAASSTGQGLNRSWQSSQRAVGQGYQVARENVAYAVDEYPLAVGGACFGLGLLLGLIAPRTRYEDELMGEQSDAMKDEATRVADDLRHRGEDIAHATLEEAKHQAEELGMTPQQLKSTAQKGVQELKGKAQEGIEQLKTAAAQKAGEAIKKGSEVVERANEAAHEVAAHAADKTRHEAEEVTSKSPSQPR